MSTLRTLPLLMGLTLLGGCDLLKDFGIDLGGKKDPAALVGPARDALDGNDLPGAMDKYQEIAAANPDVVEAKIGLAYMQLLSGQNDKADATLAEALAIEGIDDSVKNELNLRRALVALRKGDLENIRKYGELSNLPAGKVLAAEVYLADAETDSAIPLLEQASSQGSGEVKAAAAKYLDYLNDQETGRAQLAEATALWALGQREEACETAAELLAYLPTDFAQRDELLLLWAGRAVASGLPGSAEGMLDEMGGAPDGHAWRVQATRALVAVANEDFDGAKQTFANLGAGGAPADGIADALATAAAISSNKEFATEITTGLKSNALARGLMAAGATDAAKGAAPSGVFSQFLESR
jgi:tetratricopeptide (TPR) repeat protein